MPKQFMRLLIKLALLTLILIMISVGIKVSSPENHIKVLSLLIFTFFIITAFVSYVLLKTTQSKPAAFPRMYMMTFGIKLLTLLTIYVTYAISNKPTLILFTVYFSLLYFIYMVFEVRSLFTHLKPSKK